MDLKTADDLVDAENWKGSGMITGILKVGITGCPNTTNGVKQGNSRDADT